MQIDAQHCTLHCSLSSGELMDCSLQFSSASDAAAERTCTGMNAQVLNRRRCMHASQIDSDQKARKTRVESRMEHASLWSRVNSHDDRCAGTLPRPRLPGMLLKVGRVDCQCIENQPGGGNGAPPGTGRGVGRSAAPSSAGAGRARARDTGDTPITGVQCSRLP